jgi:hypothetical protein
MVRFDDDDDFFAGHNSSDGFGDFEGTEQQHHTAPSQRTRRRSSIGGAAEPSRTSSRSSGGTSRTPSSSNTGVTSNSRPSSSRRTVSRSHSYEESEMQAQVDMNKSSSELSHRPSASAGNSRRPGRRASITASSVPLRSSRSAPREVDAVVDYGYGSDDAAVPAVEDFGYGDAEPTVRAPRGERGGASRGERGGAFSETGPATEQEAPVRARRQRRCSIADVVNTASIQPSGMSSNASACSGSSDYGYGDATPDSSCPAPSSRGLTAPSGNGGVAPSSRRVGALTGASMANMAIPMAATLENEPKKMGRRGSIAMMAGIGRPKKEEKVEAATTAKKPSADRDRHRQGTLLDRVGASSGDARAGRSGTGSSYSDRILSK